MLEDYLKDNYYARFHTHSSHCSRKMYLISRLDVNFDKIIGALNEGQLHQGMVCAQECVKGNYYARFHTHSYHCYREMYFNSRLKINFDKVSES